jgi:CheY-like chemotaxis protein
MKKDIPEPVFLSAPKAATLCGVSRNTICCWIRDGKLPSMFVPRALDEIAQEDESNNAAPDVVGEERSTTQEPAILIVDDDENARVLAVRTLSRLNLPIIEAEDGYDAMHKLTKNPHIGLIILDLIMPGQDGAKTFLEIRKSNASIPVIICTGYPPDESEKLFGDLEPDLVITKPYQPSHLVNAASTFLADLGF